jgi:type II secretory pathway pseudopilin PulG
MKKTNGFALIDLLIITAIIAILGAIILPNFWAAQTKSKVSQAKADLRDLSVAISAYYVDYDVYPWVGSTMALPSTITTPVAYSKSLPRDTFGFSADYDIYKSYGISDNYWYCTKAYYAKLGTPWQVYPKKGGPADQWVLMSKGPDQAWAQADYPSTLEVDKPYDWAYDPSNGTISRGNIVRSGT